MSLNKLGRYELIRVLGRGAMGLVYEGRDPNLDRRVAIKTIKVENLSPVAAAEYEARFRIEARSAARLQHPNIVSVYDSDRDGDIAFLVMEFITGQDLKHYLDSGQAYTLGQTRAIMHDLLAALDYAHQQNIVHRDIKPANLLIEKDGRVKLTDFGVARIQDSGEATRTQGTMVGTLKYMSPEQVQGRLIDSRADVFAAGIVLYQLLTGKRPFDGATDFAIIQQIVGQMPAAPSQFNSDLPAAIDEVVMRSLAKSRDERYLTAREFDAALRAACEQAASLDTAPAVSAPPASRGGTLTVPPPGGLQSGTMGALSTVSQELELVYWKDIKESSDVQDLELFIAKFPNGIYVDLARRRLRKLGGTSLHSGAGETIPGGHTELARFAARQSDGSASGTVLLPRSSQSFDQTVFMAPNSAALMSGLLFEPSQQDPSVDLSRLRERPEVALERGADPLNEADVVSSVVRAGQRSQENARDLREGSAKQGASARRRRAKSDSPRVRAVSFLTRNRHAVWGVAGATVVLAVLSLGIGQWTGGNASVRTASSADSRPVSWPVSIPTPAVITESAPPSAGPDLVAKSTTGNVPAVRPVKRISAEREKTEKMESMSSVTAGSEALLHAERRNAPVTPVEMTPANVANVANAAMASPRQACEDRILLGFQICMADQCAKRAFTNHPICKERRAMDEQRLAEQSRRR